MIAQLRYMAGICGLLGILLSGSALPDLSWAGSKRTVKGHAGLFGVYADP